MRPVRLLPDDLADQIAAGEVVERPASVVKELIENAIDAGAQKIVVQTEGGGVALVGVTDDGHGMSPEDAALAVLRHATSKIEKREDLSSISTLGFRGEALPSIASVTRFVLRTRPRDRESGTEVRIEGGSGPEVSEIGCAPGTTVIARDLFFNVPARRKFLKALTTESAQIRDAIVRAALSEPRLHVSWMRDRRLALDLLPVADLAQRARTLFAEESLSPVEGERDGVRVRALLSAPERARTGATHLYLYVNGRAVRDRALSRAVAFAFGSVLPPGRYPAGAVYVEIDPRRVDVNVHPQKAEVRFEDARETLEAMTRVLARGLGTSPFQRAVHATGLGSGGGAPGVRLGSGAGAPGVRLGSGAGAPGMRTGAGPEPHSGPEPAQSAGDLRGPAARGHDFWAARLASPSSVADAPSERGERDPWGLDGTIAEPRPYLASPPAPGDRERSVRFSELRLLGQLRRTFLVCEGADGMIVLDQHAADERVRYDRLRAAYSAREVPLQRLLLPERLEVSGEDAALVEERAAELLAMGLEVGRIGETTVAVHTIPALVRRASPRELVREAIGQLALRGDRSFGDRIDTALATMACHGSVRAGDVLSDQEGRELLVALDRVTTFAHHCPHGRPIAFAIGYEELGRKVGR